jgi:hypothetical protein
VRHAFIFAVALLAVARAGAACEPIWPPVSVSPGSGFLIATLGSEHIGEGVLVEVERAGGAAAGYADARVVLVPWSSGPDCKRRRWRDGAWHPPGTRGVFRVLPRPRASWIGGWPTFDVEMAGLGLEPVWMDQDPRWWRPAERASLLTVDEFFSFYAALPDYDLLKRSPEQALARLEAWAREHPESAAHEPAKGILAGDRTAPAAVK